MKRTLVMLLVLAAAAGFAARAFAADDRDAAAVAHYLAAGGPLPAWARSPRLGRALVEEAASQGLSLTSNEKTSPEERLVDALRLARALAQGSIVPATVQSDWTIPVPQFDRMAVLRTLGSSDDPLPSLQALAPQNAEYRRLRAALATYESLARRGGWPTLPAGKILTSGMADPRVPILRTRLAIEGDLAGGTGKSPIFDSGLEQGLRRFQQRHGLAADGRLGPATLAALNLSAQDRSRQIAANLERWRWLPRRLPGDRIVVNAGSPRLALFSSGKAVVELRVIVGTLEHPTPVLTARIVSLLVNPPWDIPQSIALKEIGPHARRDPGYLEREGIFRRPDGRLHQLPGPKNALGLLKFEMPNPLDVYLHDTPDKRLFNRVPRFFSHGCIRVEQPQELALRLLTGQPGAAAALPETIAGGKTRRVTITPSVPIYVVYFTAEALEDGTVALYDDLYDRDAPLVALLEPQENPAD